MTAVLTMWLPSLVTAVVAWRLHRRRPETMAPALRALDRLLGRPEVLPAPVRVIERQRPQLRVVRD